MMEGREQRPNRQARVEALRQAIVGCRGTTKVLDDDVEDPGCRCARLHIHGNVRLGLFQTETTPLFDLPARDGRRDDREHDTTHARKSGPAACRHTPERRDLTSKHDHRRHVITSEASAWFESHRQGATNPKAPPRQSERPIDAIQFPSSGPSKSRPNLRRLLRRRLWAWLDVAHRPRRWRWPASA